jgi:TrmH family RNA methyltransferase
MTITSPTNQHLTEIRRLARASARARSGRFVAEGEDSYGAATAAGRVACFVMCPAGEARASREGWLEVEPSLLAGVSSHAQGSRVVAVFEQRWGEPAGPRAIALWGVRDPGNVGTVIRAAQAFGASSVALGPGCADPHGPKAVSASMGAIFAARLARVESVGELPGTVIGLDAGAPRPLHDPLPEAFTLLVGGERAGLPAEVASQCDELRAIPQVAGDSLNAAMAATVALYEATRMADR